VTRRTTLADAEAAYASAVERPDVDADRVALMGYSLGGVPALALAAHHPEVAAVAVGGVYARSSDALDDAGIGGWAWLIGSTLDPADSAEGLQGRPVLLFHGEEDRDVPPYHALELGAALLHAGAELELRLLPRATHYDVLSPGSQLHEHFVRFFRRTLHGEPAPHASGG
jgi:dipeptidyl aminopeptidase/acylaminoacyl peptidase